MNRIFFDTTLEMTKANEKIAGVKSRKALTLLNFNCLCKYCDWSIGRKNE